MVNTMKQYRTINKKYAEVSSKGWDQGDCRYKMTAGIPYECVPSTDHDVDEVVLLNPNKIQNGVSMKSFFCEDEVSSLITKESHPEVFL